MDPELERAPEDQPRPEGSESPWRLFDDGGLWPVIWCIGPASFLLIASICLVYPAACTSPPNMCFGIALIVTHAIAAVLTATQLSTRESRRPRVALWLIIIYWIGLATWLSCSILFDPRDAPGRVTGLAGFGLSYAAAAALPLRWAWRNYVGRT